MKKEPRDCFYGRGGGGHVNQSVDASITELKVHKPCPLVHTSSLADLPTHSLQIAVVEWCRRRCLLLLLLLGSNGTASVDAKHRRRHGYGVGKGSASAFLFRGRGHRDHTPLLAADTASTSSSSTGLGHSSSSRQGLRQRPVVEGFGGASVGQGVCGDGGDGEELTVETLGQWLERE